MTATVHIDELPPKARERVMSQIEAKADTVSASSPSEEQKIRRFITLAKNLDQPVGELITVAIEVKEIFASKPRGVPVIFEGCPYMTFDEPGRMR